MPNSMPSPKAATREDSIAGKNLPRPTVGPATFQLTISPAKITRRERAGGGLKSAIRQWLSGLRADPHLAPLVDFLFPDRHGFFDFLDSKPAGGKRRVPVRR